MWLIAVLCCSGCFGRAGQKGARRQQLRTKESHCCVLCATKCTKITENGSPHLSTESNGPNVYFDTCHLCWGKCAPTRSLLAKHIAHFGGGRIRMSARKAQPMTHISHGVNINPIYYTYLYMKFFSCTRIGAYNARCNIHGWLVDF